ncbi:MAG TPA: hypothetical protein PKA05_16205 [Roseiflexaceae bacterium]|nr:hypothetical protein [Roseiflexaceae bacterium]HMP41924.1 hypothetical protein [Roseiflexaceae bacterium]
MTRVIGVHEFDLKPGVTDMEFEAALRSLLALEPLPGQHVSLIKGDRNIRQGKYGMLSNHESVEARDRFFGANGETDAFKEFQATHPEWVQAWEQVMSLVAQWTWTDYQIFASSS